MRQLKIYDRFRKIRRRQMTGNKKKKSFSCAVSGLLRAEKGIALVIALLMSIAIMALVAGVLHFITQSTGMSGAGRRYATATEAADGAVDLVKDSINMVMWGEPVAPGKFAGCDEGDTLTDAILNQNQLCTTQITLPGTVGNEYTAEVTLLRLYTTILPGGRLEFARSTGGASSTAIFYRITTTVTNNTTNERAENSALYRFTG